MTMHRTPVTMTAAAALALAVTWTAADDPLAGQPQSVQVPIFEYDPTFPKPLPEN